MTPEERAARERKQKIFVVVGGILLLGMLAIQLPKLLGGSGETAAATTPAPGAVASDSPTPVALGGSTRNVSSPGTLTVLGPFRKKNPFVQLVTTADATASEVAPPDTGKKSEGESGASKTFSTGEKPVAPAVTIVSVNGERQTVEPGAAFPAADPVFVLVSEQPKSKSVVVGVVGGAYAGGSKTAKLKLGKPLTLVNTATGAKYKITLVSVGSGEAVDKSAPPK
jgi:hypothetical protein